MSSILIRTEDKKEFLEDLKEQTIRFLKSEKARLKIEREFLKKVQEGLKEADKKHFALIEVEVYADVSELLKIEFPKQEADADVDEEA
jgi:hypothetical protein